MAASLFSMEFTVSATFWGSCPLDAANMESKEAAFIVFPVFPPTGAPRCDTSDEAFFFKGGTVFSLQYKKAINIIANEIVI